MSIHAIGKRNEGLAFWATHSGAKVGHCWQESGKNRATKVKYADAPLKTRSMSSPLNDLELAHLWVVYPGDKAHSLGPRATKMLIGAIKDRWQYTSRASLNGQIGSRSRRTHVSHRRRPARSALGMAGIVEILLKIAVLRNRAGRIPKGERAF